MRRKKEVRGTDALRGVCPRTVCGGQSVIQAAINAVWGETVAELERVSIFVLHDFSAAVLHSIAAPSILSLFICCQCWSMRGWATADVVIADLVYVEQVWRGNEDR
jgi:hypothetical protein